MPWGTTGQSLKGPKGDTGSQGPAGSQGPKGDTGAQGPAGTSGPYLELDVPAGSTSAVLTHNLNTEAIICQVREVATGLLVPVACETVDENGARSLTKARLTFLTAPTAGQYKALFVAGGGVDWGPIRTQIFGGPARTQAPVCSLYLPANRTMTTSDNWFMDAQWAVEADTDSIWLPGIAADGKGCMVIPITGRYRLHWHAEMGGVAPAKMVAKIYRNGTSYSQNVIGAAGSTTASGWNEPNHMDVIVDDRVLQAGDKLWFGCWADVANVVLYANGSQWGGGSSQLRTTATLTWMGPN